MFKNIYNNPNDLDKAIGKYLEETNFNSEERQINYDFYIDNFKELEDEELIQKFYNKFKSFKYSGDTKRRLTEYLPKIREYFEE